MKKHLCINVFGRVQGVWFRQSTYNEAIKLGLKGTVQNLGNGSVEIHVEGEETALQELLNWCEEGPEHANVDRIEQKVQKLKHFESFNII